MMTWQHFTPSNQTTPIHQHNSQVEDSPSALPGLLVEETLEFQAEYPWEVVEVVEEVEEVEAAVSLLQYQRNKQLPMGETNSLATRLSYSQEIARNPKRS